MKKIGREVLFLRTNENCARNGEDDFIRLNDNTIMMIYTDYGRGNCKEDHTDAKLTAIFSYDDGETWADKRTVVTKEDEADNVMSVSLIRMKNGDIGLFYLQIGRDANGNTKESYLLRRSSDDDGEIWQESEKLYPLFKNDAKGLREPGVFQREDGTLHLWMRTDFGFQFEAFSTDNGETWTDIQPNKFFTSPCSPMQIKSVGKYTVAVFNPVPQSGVLKNGRAVGEEHRMYVR